MVCYTGDTGKTGKKFQPGISYGWKKPMQRQGTGIGGYKQYVRCCLLKKDAPIPKFSQAEFFFNTVKGKYFLKKLRCGTFFICQIVRYAQPFKQMKQIRGLQFRFQKIIIYAELETGFGIGKIVIAA